MRDINRIQEVVSKLDELWKKNPDWRLGQLLINLVKISNPDLICPELFYLEDDKVLKLLNQCLTKKD